MLAMCGVVGFLGGYLSAGEKRLMRDDDDDDREYAWGGGASAAPSRGGKARGGKKLKAPKAGKVPRGGGKARQTKIAVKGAPKFHTPKATAPKPVEAKRRELLDAGKKVDASRRFRPKGVAPRKRTAG